MSNSRWFTVADLRGHISREAPSPLTLVADAHASVASAVSRSLAEVAPVLAPVTSLGLMQRVVPILAPLVLVSDLDFEGVATFDSLLELHRTHSAIRIVAYSGHSNEVIRQMVGKAGFFGFVAKLDPLDELQAVIELAREELRRQPIHQDHKQAAVDMGRRHRKPHDLGALIRWALGSEFKPGAISRVLHVSPPTVAYHARRQAGLGTR